ncbi:hypothetical protein KY345_04485 [Candidatus Woesearchaeota archaeon]|nr:hypothetical protein [Candidatus Woesearchaeota archaeon]
MKQRHEIIKDHIKKRVKKGHDIITIKQDLIDRGLPHHEIHKAIDLFYEDIHKAEEFAEETEKFFYPTKGKLILPVILIIILILHFAVNIFQLPPIGEDLCTSAQISGIFENLRNRTISPETRIQYLKIQKEILDTQTKLIDRYKIVLTTNFPLIYSKVYLLNPLFTLPCETTFLFNNKRCRYYMTEESYTCLNKTEVKDPNIETVFKYGLPEYRRISGFNIFINSLILFIELYILSAVFIYYKNKLKKRLSRRTREIIEITGIIIAILLIIFAVLYYIYLWRLL